MDDDRYPSHKDPRHHKNFTTRLHPFDTSIRNSLQNPSFELPQNSSLGDNRSQSLLYRQPPPRVLVPSIPPPPLPSYLAHPNTFPPPGFQTRSSDPSLLQTPLPSGIPPSKGPSHWWQASPNSSNTDTSHSRETQRLSLSPYDAHRNNINQRQTSIPKENQFESSSGPEFMKPLSDDEWIYEWLAARKQHVLPQTPVKTLKNVKICEASKFFKTSIKLHKELESLHDQLLLECEIVNSDHWTKKWNEVEVKKAELQACLDKLSVPGVLDDLKVALIKRSKKRTYQKRRRARVKEEVAESHSKRQQLDIAINTWLEDMQESVEKAKREESLKVEADLVLLEVTRKKNEAKRQLSLLLSLLKLRQLRAKTWASRGQAVSFESGERFTKVIERLRKLWESELRECAVEEKGLRVMLEGVVEERNQKQVRRERQALAQWEQVLFGAKKRQQDQVDRFYTAAERDIESFVAIRKSWDKFLAAPGASMASTPPIGWVLPVYPSSEQWKAQLSGGPE
uniref:Programmed cell death protein 7 n=1 Tax=Timema bartmani TaxID=61472 RepID=A0A7R9EN27_9NEOP|nr:unnamed protein product [Timema bartmani]